MKKILITDAVDKKCADYLESTGFEVNYSPGMKKEEIEKIIKNYNSLIVRSETKVTSDLISLMQNMEVIGRAGTGVDNIDLEAATRKGIMVMNTPGGNTISTAEHTMSLMLSMFRNISQANQDLRVGKWNRKAYKGTELEGKTIGVIGLGKIGREVALRCKAFDMNVAAYDPVVSEDVVRKLGVSLVDLETIFKESDVITLHVPLNNETKHLISKKNLSKCKNGVRIINCARGGIVDEEAVVEGLNSGKIAGAAFDVYEVEPPQPDSPLIQHPKVVATPHLGASTEEAQEKVALQIAEQISDLFNQKGVRGAVNVVGEFFGKKELFPYSRLAENLGTLHAQLIKGKLKKININYSGELLHSGNGLLATSVLKGFLSQMVTDYVNYINAPLLAKEMGIILNETKSGANSNYVALLTVDFITDGETRSLSGTVFGNNEIRIVYIDDFHLELKPEGDMLFYSNIDKPGMLATVGRILADANINIAGLSLGRKEVGKEALTVINIDSPMNKNVVEKISSIQGVKNVYAIKI